MNSSLNASVLPHHPARVGQNVFLGFAWGGVAVTAVFFASRICIRIVSFRKLFADDFLVLLAWLMFLANAILWQVYASDLYEHLAAQAGQLFPLPPTFAADVEAYLKATAAIQVFFYCGLWFIKFSFLIFFRRLGNQVRGQKVHWWMVTAIIVTSWVVSLGIQPYSCLTGTLQSEEEHCISGYAVDVQKQLVISSMVIDVITDILVTSIPISLLWKVKISLRQKLALMGIFSLTIFVMIIAIVRVVAIIDYSISPDSWLIDESWLYLWTSIEQTVSIMIACLASLRQLFVKQESSRRKVPGSPSGSSSRRRLLGARSARTWFSTRGRLPDHDPSEHGIPTRKKSHTAYGVGLRTNESGENILPLQGIRVQRDFEALSYPRTTI